MVFVAILGAALVGTLVANAFYMTMSFSYFYAFLIFPLAAAASCGGKRTAGSARSAQFREAAKRARVRASSARS